MRELLLLRHAKSDWTTGVGDFERPLEKRGELDAHRVGIWLFSKELVPDYIVCSPAMRALETACFACNTMSIPCNNIITNKNLYEASPKQLLKIINNFPIKVQRALLVGHNPEMEDLLLSLVDKSISIPTDGKLLPTAALARLKISDNWHSLSPGQAKLISITRSKSLPKKFPYPSPSGEILRKRPAYYYTQSAALPYRIKNGKLEIILITSTKKHKWIIPKGIVEPGMSAKTSAGKEAFEEAGVYGKVSDKCIGSYRYEKWQAECVVDVYPFKVSRVSSEKNWQESHRKRDWFSVEQAAEKLQQPELVSMLNILAEMLEAKRG